jgi:hypothetical protein
MQKKASGEYQMKKVLFKIILVCFTLLSGCINSNIEDHLSQAAPLSKWTEIEVGTTEAEVVNRLGLGWRWEAPWVFRVYSISENQKIIFIFFDLDSAWPAREEKHVTGICRYSVTNGPMGGLWEAEFVAPAQWKGKKIRDLPALQNSEIKKGSS